MAATAEEIEHVTRNATSRFAVRSRQSSGVRSRRTTWCRRHSPGALTKRRQFKRGSLEAWIWRIVVRQALDLHRRPAALLERELEAELVVSDGDPELATAIRALPPRRRLIVFLRYFADLSYEAIAELCDISEGTVGAALTQAHAELREQLQPRGAKR